MSITTITQLQQGVANLQERFSVPPRFLVKEDFDNLVSFLNDTNTYLYSLIGGANVATNTELLTSLYNNLSAIENAVSFISTNGDNLTNVANDLTNINNVANDISTINVIANSLTVINNVLANANTATTQAGIATTQANTATTAFINFDKRYLGSKISNPSLDNEGTALLTGAQYWNSVSNVLKVYNGTSWLQAYEAGTVTEGILNKITYTAIDGQTNFNIVHDVGFVDVYYNGLRLQYGIDFIDTNTSKIVLTTGSTSGDVIEVVAYGTFTLTDVVSSSTTINSHPLISNITLTTADIADSTDKRYITDVQKLALGSFSGVNTGDETTSTIKTKLGISTLSGSNTGDQTNISGNAATVTTNANLTGDVTSIGNVTTLINSAVINKVLTGYTSGAGVVGSGDSILVAIQKLNGNDVSHAGLTTTAHGGLLQIGTTGTTACAGNDSRLTNNRNTTNNQIIKFDTGTIEDTDLYTFNGSIAKTIDIKAGSNITFAKVAGSITIAANSTGYTLPTATSSVLGGVKPDGTTITNTTGIISVTYGSTGTSACVGNDSRLSNSRTASDVSSWAKAGTKPTYTYTEVGAQVAGAYPTGSGTCSGTNTGDQIGGTPALTFSTTNTAGSSTNFLRRDDTIAIFDTTAPTTQAFGDTATAGSAAVAARRDHKHAMPNAPTATISYLVYDSRASLRAMSPTEGDFVLVKSLGLFRWYNGSTEPDDDETAFATASGVWELECPAWDFIDTVFNLIRSYIQVYTVQFINTISSVSPNSTVTLVVTVPGVNLNDYILVVPAKNNSVNYRGNIYADVTDIGIVTISFTNSSNTLSYALSTGDTTPYTLIIYNYPQ